MTRTQTEKKTMEAVAEKIKDLDPNWCFLSDPETNPNDPAIRGLISFARTKFKECKEGDYDDWCTEIQEAYDGDIKPRLKVQNHWSKKAILKYGLDHFTKEGMRKDAADMDNSYYDGTITSETFQFMELSDRMERFGASQPLRTFICTVSALLGPPRTDRPKDLVERRIRTGIMDALVHHQASLPTNTGLPAHMSPLIEETQKFLDDLVNTHF